MTLTKDKRTGYYKARVKTQGGSTTTISTKATSKPEAKRILKQSRLAEIEEAAKAGKLTEEGLTRIIAGKRITVKDALAEYETRMGTRGRSPIYIRSTMIMLNTFAETFGITNKPVSAITEQIIDKFINSSDQRHATWRMTQRSGLSRFCEFLNDKGWIAGNPARLTEVRMEKLSHEQKERKERHPFTDAEIAKILAKTDIGSFWHAAVCIGRYTGLRLGDVAMLEWETLRVPNKITVWTDKRNRRVNLDIHPVLQQALSAVPPNGTPYLFPEQAAVAADPVRRANLSTYFRRVCHDAGIEGKTFHDLRAAYCSDCNRRGIPIEHIAQRVGHSSVVTTRGYIKD